MKRVPAVVKIVLVLLSALILTDTSLRFASAMPTDLTFLWARLSQLETTTAAIMLARYYVILVGTLIAVALDILLMLNWSYEVPILKYRFGDTRNLPSLLVAYWIFTVLSYPFAVGPAAGAFQAEGMDQVTAYSFAEPVAMILTSSLALLIRFAISTRVRIGTKNDRIWLGETFLLVVFGELLFETFFGTANPIYLLVNAQPAQFAGEVSWTWLGGLVVSAPFALLDRALFRPLQAKVI